MLGYRRIMPEKEQKINGRQRIFCVITQGEMGGAQRFVAQLAQNLDRDRFLLHVVWGAESGNELARLLPEHVTHAVAEHLVRRWSVWHDVLSVFELRRQMRAYRPDVVLCISSKAGFNGSLAARPLRRMFPNMNVIYRIGGWTFNDPIPAWERGFYTILERWSAHWKDYIVLNNTHDFEQAKKLHIHPRRGLLRIYNGLDPYLSFLTREEARESLNHRISEHLRLNPEDPVVGTIANLYPTKGISTLIGAASAGDPAIRYVVLGDGPQHHELEQLVHRHGLQNRFFLLGRVKDAWKYIPAFDVFALPSVKEGFPWALLEAMAAKMPVVATRVGAVPEMIENGVSGIICEPKNAEQFTHGIARLFTDTELGHDMAINAHQQVLAKFSLRDMMAHYEELFTK